MKLKDVSNGFFQMNIPWRFTYILGNIKWVSLTLNLRNPTGLKKVSILGLLNQ